MGDDTWMSVFPNSFEPNMTFPYDSFNVEDLHTVDEGVIKHLFPLLEDPTKPFDFLIGHFLGVDHVGHRVGPDHPSMKAKLQQMNNVLKRVVELLDDDTLLVVLGDHGMDRSGDHGGDGILETSSALWVYSKKRTISQTSIRVPSGLVRYTTYPDSTVPHRAIQQIDIVPTLSLLLGLPIPFNNLGTVIPELFWRDRRGTDLTHALELNAAQIKTYLDTYRSSPSGGELDDSWQALQSAWTATETASSGESKWIPLSSYNYVALSACRSMWAQFNRALMGLGLTLLGIGLLATWSVYTGLSRAEQDWDLWLSTHLPKCFLGAAGGAVVGFVGYLPLASYLPGIDATKCTVFAATLASSLILIISSPPPLSMNTIKTAPIILILHTLAFFSNSFTFWEDRIVPFFLVTSIIPYARTGFSAPVLRLRYRIIGFSLLFALCVRLMAISTICREEQQPYCHVTFYASSTIPSPPFPVLLLAVPVALGLPLAISRFLHITRSDLGLARPYLSVIMCPSLISGTAYWVLEWIDSAGIIDDAWSPFLRMGRTWLARLAFSITLIGGGAFWWLVPMCLEVKIDEVGEKRQVKVLGYANAFGSPYFVFWSIGLTAVFTTTQLTGQLVLALATIALLAYLEVLDSVRDVRNIEAAFATATPSALLDADAPANQSPPIRFADVVPVALLGVHAFFGTGHQSTISSIQWKSAFLLTPTLTYPFAPMTVVLNSVGPLFVMGLAVPLVALWNRAPLSTLTSPETKTKTKTKTTASDDRPSPDVQVKGESTLAALGIMMYFVSLLLGTAMSAAILRRHLMVWKVFAPRFMTGVLGVLVVDVAVLVGVGLGVERITYRIGRLFRGPVVGRGS
jgi:phosphatidylinositol glycan class O